MALFTIFLNSCSSKINLQIVRPPIHKIEKIEFIEIGDFKFVDDEITLAKFSESISPKKTYKMGKLLNPPIENFISNKNNSPKIVDLIRSTVLHEISINTPYIIYTKKDNATDFSGIVPDSDKVAILNAKIKFFEKQIESKEDISYFTNIKNRGVSLEQNILARTISMGVESSGVGYKVSTPYVEKIAIIEVEFALTKKNNRKNIIPKQTIQSYFLKKWGGDPYSSHLPKKTKNFIIKKYQEEKDLFGTIFSRVNQAGLSFSDPSEYFERGFTLKSSALVPKNSLEIEIDLSRQVAKKFLKLISPYSENSEIILKDGNKIAKTLIKGNAFQEAIFHLQGIDNRNAEDEYNLGLSFEAIGETKKANFYYEIASTKDPNEDLYIKAVERTKN